MKKYLLPLAILLSLTACVLPTLDPKHLPAEGSVKPPQNAEQMIKAHFDETLKDPDSARYKYGQTGRAAVEMRGKVYSGAIQLVDVNAKNSYGGYTGYKQYALMFFQDGVLDVTPYLRNTMMAIYKLDPPAP